MPEHSHGNSSFGDLAPTTISTAPMGRYRTKLRPADIAFIQLVAGGPMRRHGYAIDAVDLHGAERWRFAAVPPREQLPARLLVAEPATPPGGGAPTRHPPRRRRVTVAPSPVVADP